MSDPRRGKPSPGPFHPEQVRSKDPYELSNGHPVWCAPTGKDGTGPSGLGFSVLDSDPLVKSAGVDTGIDLGKKTLRAPDVAVNFEPGPGTWATSTALAVEYAGQGQDEPELRTKIRQLLAAGTRWVWVVRLVGPRRVEVHTPNAAVRLAGIDEELTAPGVLALPVPVRALFERDAAHETTLRNLLRARGVESLDALQQQAELQGVARGREEGRIDAFAHLFARRLGRALTESESAAARARARSLGLARLEDVALEMNRDELAAWLADPSAV